MARAALLAVHVELSHVPHHRDLGMVTNMELFICGMLILISSLLALVVGAVNRIRDEIVALNRPPGYAKKDTDNG